MTCSLNLARLYPEHAERTTLYASDGDLPVHLSAKRTKGSHRQYKHPTQPGGVTIPGHPGDDLHVGTLKSILVQAGSKEKM